MSTARNIIERAFRKAGVIGATDTPTAQEANDALSTMNAMISSWGNNPLFITARAWENFPLTAGVAEYTIGTGQTFDTARPLKLLEAHYRIGSTDYDLNIIDDITYNNITSKTVQSMPDSINYDNGYPAGKLRLYPVPASNYTLYILTEKPLTEYTIDQDVDLPPGWERAIIYNLAIELAVEYEQPINPAVSEIAGNAKDNIMLQIERARGKDWGGDYGTDNNIFTGWYVR